MANRKNTFLIKRSNIAGKIPSAGDLLLGELGLNIADVILYASGTTANSILPIGWDRVARTGDTMTGGLFTPYLSATTISATSINKVDYIIFNTGTTSAATVAGTIYFDNTEHALSYNTSINQGVTVNLGQQNYLRVFNNSGTDIPRGKALEVLSAYSGLPSVTLAVNKNTGFNIIGVSAEIIPNNSEGIIITNGIISNIELTGMTVGSLVFASDTIPGKLDDYTNFLTFPLSARTNNIGYVVQTGVTTGKLFVNINNENSVLSLTDLERNVLEGNTLSTGLFEFTGMTTASTTTFNVAPLKGWIVKNTYEYALTPDVLGINYTGGTNISVTNILTADSTYILINSGLTITQQVTFPTPQQRRENIYLGKVNHPNRTSILNINNTADYDVSPMSSLRDLWSPIRLINQGIIPSPNGANLSFNTSAGTLWGNGINWHNNQLSPNNVNITGKTPASFNYRTQTGGTSSSVTVINPRDYDVNGVITSIGNANLDSATNQRIYMYPSGVINVLYGQTIYTNLTAAVAAVQSEAFIPYPNAESSGILIGILSVRNDIGTDSQPLTNTSYAKFTFVSKFGESFGGTGGLSTTTLQQAYDNSSSPEIVINAALDGLSIKNGTGNSDITTRLLEGLNAAGNATSFIRADGDISGTTLQTNGFTGNSTGMSALTVNIRTVGSGTPITNLGVDIFGNVVSGTTGGSTFTGGTVNGPTFFTNGLTANTISATTYYGLPTDVYSTGGTYNGGNIYVTNNTGGTFTITGLTSTGFSANYYGSFSDTTTQRVLSADTAIAWTYNTTELSNGISVVNGSQIKVANKGVYEIGYSAQIEKTGVGTATDVTIWARINGNDVTRTSSTLGFANNNTYQLPFVSFMFEMNANDYVEFYFSSPSTLVQITTISGLTAPIRPVAPSVIIVAKQVGLSVTDNLGGNYLPLSGGTVSGGTVFNNGLTANTFSATTIKTPSFTANNGGITATTVSATTYYNLPTDIRVTGGTYSNNEFTYTNNTGGTFNVLFNTMTGLTVNGNLTVTGNTLIQELTATTISASTVLSNDLTITGGTQSWFSGDSASDLVRITQTGSGNALVVEDSNNPDASQFVVDASGNVGIGTNTPISKLQISNTATTVNPALYTSDFVTLTAEGTAPGFNIVSAGDAFGNRGVFKATRSRGTLSSPTVPQSGDITFSLLGAIYDGVTNWATAGVSFEVDGTVTANTTPQRIIFSTSTGNTRSERLRITSNGDVGIGITSPTTKLDVSGGARINGGLTATTISATTYYNLPTDIYVTGGTYSSGTTVFTNNTGGTFTVTGFSTGSTTNIGSGTINYLPKWTGSTALGNSLIRDDGTNIGINTTPSSDGKVTIYTLTGNTSALYVQNQSAANSYGVYSFLNSGIGSQTAILGDAQGHPTTGTSIGVFGFANDGLVGIGVKGQVGTTEFGTMTTGIGGYFDGRGDGGYSYPVTSYSVQLLDGTEGVNKVLVSKTSDGKANWSSSLSGLTGVYTNILSATTINATNLFVTGSTQSIFSGNSSVEMVKVIQNGSGDAFVVEDIANGDASHFVINASGNTAIGLTQPIGTDKLTVSGDTSIYGAFKSTTISATTYLNLPSLNQAQIFIGDTSNVSQARTISGDISLNYSGLTTIQPNVVTYSKIQSVSQNALLGSPNISGGTVQEVPMIDAYISSGTAYALLTNSANWDIDGIYTGSTITGTYQGQSIYNNLYWFTAVDDNTWIRLLRG